MVYISVNFYFYCLEEPIVFEEFELHPHRVIVPKCIDWWSVKFGFTRSIRICRFSRYCHWRISLEDKNYWNNDWNSTTSLELSLLGKIFTIHLKIVYLRRMKNFHEILPFWSLTFSPKNEKKNRNLLP